MHTITCRFRRLLASREGSLGPVVIMSLVAMMLMSSAALMMSAHLATSGKNMDMIDASSEVSLDFTEQIIGQPTEDVAPGDDTVVTSTQGGLSRSQELVMSEDMLIVGFNDKGDPRWGSAQGVDGARGVWIKTWGDD